MWTTRSGSGAWPELFGEADLRVECRKNGKPGCEWEHCLRQRDSELRAEQKHRARADGCRVPPKSATPGSVGDANYSPFVRIENAANVIYNAPVVAFGVDASQITFPNGNVDYTKVHDQVVAIDPANMTVTVNLINGFSFGRPVWYLSMDTSIPLGAAIEHNTYAPLMGNLVLGHDDSFQARLSASLSPPTDRRTRAAIIRCGRDCRRILRMDSGQTMFLAAFLRLRSITVRRGMRSFLSGLRMRSAGDSAGSCERSFRSSRLCRMV